MAGVSLRPRLAVPLLFLLATIVLFAPFVFLGRYFLAADFLFHTPLWYDPHVPLHNFDLLDGILIYYPLEKLMHDCLHRGTFPLWSPWTFGGYTPMGDGDSGFAYPPRIVLDYLCSPVAAHDLLVLLHIWFGACGMYWLGRRIELSRPAAFLAGLVWMFCGPSTTAICLENVPLCQAWVPYILVGCESVARDRRWLTPLALAWGMLLTAGHLQVALYACVVIALVAGYRWSIGGRSRVHLIRMGAALAVGATLASPWLLTTADQLTRSQRPDEPLSYLIYSQRQFLMGVLPTLVAPDALGTPVDHFAINRVPHAGYFVYLETCIYCGLSPLLLALAGVRRRGMPLFLALVGLLAIVVPATPLYAIVYALPVFNHLNPTRMIMLWAFSVSLLAGFGLDSLRDWLRRRLLVWTGVLAAVMAVAVVSVQVWVSQPQTVLSGWLAQGLVRLPDPSLFLSRTDYLAAVVEGFRAVYRWNGAAMGWPLLLVAAFLMALALRVPKWVMVAMAAVDLLSFGLRFNTTVPASMIYPPTETIRFLQANAGFDRVMGVGTIKPSELLPFRLLDVGGYDSIYPGIVSDFWTWSEYGDLADEHRFNQQVFPLKRYTSPLVNLMGVRYLVAYPQQKLPGYPLVAAQPLPVYENPHRLPRVWVATRWQVVSDGRQQLATLSDAGFDARTTALLFSPPEGPVAAGGGTAEMVSYDNNTVVVHVQGGGGLLVLSDVWDPGWQAMVDDRPAPVLRTDYMLRSVPVPPGSHHVVFRFVPRPFRLGLTLAAAGTLGLLWWAVSPGHEKRTRPSLEAGP